MLILKRCKILFSSSAKTNLKNIFARFLFLIDQNRGREKMKKTIQKIEALQRLRAVFPGLLGHKKLYQMATQSIFQLVHSASASFKGQYVTNPLS